jgi:hypothetical protein
MTNAEAALERRKADLGYRDRPRLASARKMGHCSIVKKRMHNIVRSQRTSVPLTTLGASSLSGITTVCVYVSLGEVPRLWTPHPCLPKPTKVRWTPSPHEAVEQRNGLAYFYRPSTDDSACGEPWPWNGAYGPLAPRSQVQLPL